MVLKIYHQELLFFGRCVCKLVHLDDRFERRSSWCCFSLSLSSSLLNKCERCCCCAYSLFYLFSGATSCYTQLSQVVAAEETIASVEPSILLTPLQWSVVVAAKALNLVPLPALGKASPAHRSRNTILFNSHSLLIQSRALLDGSVVNMSLLWDGQKRRRSFCGCCVEQY